MKRTALSLAVGLLLGLAAPANASTFNFEYHNTGSTYTGIGQFFGNLISGTTYLLTNATGTEVDPTGTHTITGISNFAGADNNLSLPPSTYLVDFNGISFTTTSPTNAWGIGLTPSNTYGITDLVSNPNGYCCGVNPIEFSVAETPLPAAGLLFGSVLGIGGLFAARRKRKQGASLGSNMVPA